VRHRRHTLRATALLPCVAVLLVTPLTSAASDPGAPSGATRDPVRDVRTTSTVADPLPQEPVVADESGVLPVRILMSGAGSTVSVPGGGLTDKSPSSQGTSGSRTPGDDDATSGTGRERGTPTTTGEEQRTPHVPRSPHRSPTESVRPGHSSAQPDGQHNGPSQSAPPDRPNSAGGDRKTGRDSAGKRDTHHAGNVPGAVPGTEDLYEPEPPERDPRTETHRSAKEAATGEVSPVLPLGAGLTSIGLGLALLALRLRRG
jgi:hypothetical protein